MKLKDFAKITKVYDEIKALDVELKNLHKIAQSVAHNESEVKLNLNITDLKLKTKLAKENIVNSDGDLMLPRDFDDSMIPTAEYISNMVYGKTNTTVYKMSIPKPAYESEYTDSLCDVSSLEILGLLIGNKENKKNALIKSLAKYKITL